MNIRPMQKGDLPAVVRIDQACFSQPWPPEGFEIELENPNARCWVAESGTQGSPLAGALVLWRVLDEAHIATIAVDPQYQRQGIGTALMLAGMRAAYQEGARIYHLEVRAGNLSAQGMYTRLGFLIVGKRPKYYKNNGEDALLMTLESQTEPVLLGKSNE